MTPQPPTHTHQKPEGRRSSRSRRAAAWGAILAIAALAGGRPAAAQADASAALAARSAIVVLGTVLKVGASEEPLLAPTSATVVIKIDKMYAGSEIAGDQAGRHSTVILSKPGELAVGSQALFFGNPRYIGKTLTIADEGELPAPRAEAGAVPRVLAEALQARREAPLRERLAAAETIFRGTVQDIRPLPAATRGRKPGLRDEHDPDWQVATVRVTSPIKNAKTGADVAVVFAASKDIMWFRSPKLRPGDSAVILGQRQESEPALTSEAGARRYLEGRHAVVVTNPFDALPGSEVQRVTELLHSMEVPR